jgi:hypothetical protein
MIPSLLFYIKSRLDAGLSWQTIKNALKGKGWKDKDIEEAGYIAHNPSSSTIPAQKDLKVEKAPSSPTDSERINPNTVSIQTPKLSKIFFWIIIYGIINYLVSYYEIAYVLKGDFPIGFWQLAILFGAIGLLFYRNYRKILPLSRSIKYFIIPGVIFVLVFGIGVFIANLDIENKFQPQAILADVSINLEAKKYSELPTIYINYNSEDFVRQLIKSKTSEKSKLYSSYVNKKFIKDTYFVLSETDIKQITDKNIIFLDNSVFINKAKKDLMVAIMPNLSYLMIKKYFEDKYIVPDDVKTLFLSRQEYYLRSEPEINYQIAQIDTYIKNEIAMLNQIQNGKNGINEYIKTIDDQRAERNQAYLSCVTEKLPTGKLKYSASECILLVKNYDDVIKKNLDVLVDLETTLSKYLMAVYGVNDINNIDWDMVKSYYEQIIRDNYRNTLAVYNPTSKVIWVIYEDESLNKLPELFSSVIHEYLHFVTDSTPGMAFHSSPIEEGLTEYYAREIVRMVLNKEVGIGYADTMLAIKNIVAGIPKDELISIYFRKDATKLYSLIYKKFGNKYDYLFQNEYSPTSN